MTERIDDRLESQAASGPAAIAFSTKRDSKCCVIVVETCSENVQLVLSWSIFRVVRFTNSGRQRTSIDLYDSCEAGQREPSCMLVAVILSR